MYSIRRNTPQGTTTPFKGISTPHAAQEILADMARSIRRQGLKQAISTDNRAVFWTQGGLVELQIINE